MDRIFYRVVAIGVRVWTPTGNFLHETANLEEEDSLDDPTEVSIK